MFRYFVYKMCKKVIIISFNDGNFIHFYHKFPKKNCPGNHTTEL